MGMISLKVAFQLRSFLAGDFAGGAVISPGFNGVAGLGIDGASGGGSGAGSLSLEAANAIQKPKRVIADSDTIFFIVIRLLRKLLSTLRITSASHPLLMAQVLTWKISLTKPQASERGNYPLGLFSA